MLKIRVKSSVASRPVLYKLRLSAIGNVTLVIDTKLLPFINHLFIVDVNLHENV